MWEKIRLRCMRRSEWSCSIRSLNEILGVNQTRKRVWRVNGDRRWSIVEKIRVMPESFWVREERIVAETNSEGNSVHCWLLREKDETFWDRSGMTEYQFEVNSLRCVRKMRLSRVTSKKKLMAWYKSCGESLTCSLLRVKIFRDGRKLVKHLCALSEKMELVLFNSEWGPWRDSTQLERLRLYYLFWKGWAKLESFRAGKQSYESKFWELEEKSRICDVREVSHVISDSNRCKIQLWWMEYDILSPRSYNDHLLSTESENVQ